jgi:hypothetical protein
MHLENPLNFSPEDLVLLDEQGLSIEKNPGTGSFAVKNQITGLWLNFTSKEMISFHRMQDFATRMINTENLTPQRKEKLHEDMQEFITGCLRNGIRSWDEPGSDGICGGTYFDDLFYETYSKHNEHGEQVNKYFNILAAFAKASIDVAFENYTGGGVLGFSVGFVRKMYNNSLPDWITEPLGINTQTTEDDLLWL